MMATMKVAIARQMVSLTSFCQIAQMHSTVQMTSEVVMMPNEMTRTSRGLTTPLASLFERAGGIGSLCSATNNFLY